MYIKKNSLHGPPTALQPVKGGHLYARMSVPLVSNCSSTRRWAKASVMGRCILSQGGKRSPFMRMEAIRLLLCVLYVRSRATFSVRHQLRGHTQSSSGICPACAFSLEPWQRQRYARAMRVVNFSRLFARQKHFASPSGQWRSENF